MININLMDIKSLKRFLKKGFFLSKKPVVKKKSSLQNLFKISFASLLLIFSFMFCHTHIIIYQKHLNLIWK